MQLPGARWVRACLVVLLLFELLNTIHWPWAPATHPRQIDPTWVEKGELQYHSTVLLKRSQAAMQYNKDSQQYETPQMAIYFHADRLFSSNPAAGVATWLDLLVTAKYPWATYWLFVAAPPSWRVIPEQTQQELNLLSSGLPVLVPSTDAQMHFSAPERWLLRQLGHAPDSFVPDMRAVCTAAVNHTTLQPSDTVTCNVFEGRADDDSSESLGVFSIVRDKVPAEKSFMSKATAAAAAERKRASSASCSLLGPGLVLGPGARWVARAAQQWRPAAATLRVLRQLWRAVVPTGSMSGPLCPLLERVHLLSYEYLIESVLLQALVIMVNARNWLYLITVCYKIGRRLSLLAPAPLRARLSGAALTFVGMFLGLWQSVAYTAIDTAFDIAVFKCIYVGLSQCGLAALVAWWVWWTVLGKLRIGNKAWQVTKLAFKEARMLVLAPQALLVQNQVLVDKLPRRQVATVGSWPDPLVIPEEVDELPVSDVPRGFICPITQAIMRQPALLLHDQTIAPSTYDKEAISQWLSEHSSDPKNPGAQLSMKSVKLVYNGDLGRSIEDWVLATRQQQQQQQEQQQQQTGLAAWRRALSGHLDGQQPLEGLNAEGMAAAAAGVLMQMRGNMSSGVVGPGGGGAAAAGGAGAAAAAAAAAGAAARAGTVGAAGGVAAANRGAAAGNGGAAAAAAAAAAGESGSILSGAGAIVRTSSAALAQVASMDLPAVAVAGLNQLAGTTRRITTRALSRRQQQQQQQGEGGHLDHQQQRQRQRQQQQQQQQRQARDQHDEPDDIDNDDDSGSQSDSSGSSSEVESRQQEGPRGRQRRSRGVSPAGNEERQEQLRRRPTRSTSQPAAAAGGAGTSGFGH